MKAARLATVILSGLFWAQAGLPAAQAADVGLKISAENNWYAWGDYILGQDMKSGFERLGYSVQPAYMDNFYPAGSEDSKIDVYMHGFIPFNPPENAEKINVLYLYYPLETSNMEKFKNLKGAVEPDWLSLQTELWDFQLAAVASPTYQKEIEKFGIKTIFVPQFTDPKKFYYEYTPEAAYDILFVGRPGYERISARWAIESGFDVALFGEGWKDKAPAEMFKGNYIDNNELHKYYASAKIVLNDTREDMKKAGFISNRVFDVTASGGFLISDYMPEIEQFYGDNIPMFKSKEELKELDAFGEPETSSDANEDEVPEVPEEVVTKPGDIWLLGEHRLLCGDTTIYDDVKKLMQDDVAAMIFTDPPYNVNYGSTLKDSINYHAGSLSGRKIMNDNLGDGFAQFLTDSLSNMMMYCKTHH